jgi:hypothetical protein
MVWENRFGPFAFADDLHPYTPTRRATFVGIEPAANESAAAAAVRVKFDVPPRAGANGEPVEEVIPLPRVSHDGRPLTDAFAMIPPGVAVPGRAVEFTTRDEDGVAVLSELRLAGTVRWRRRDLVELQAGSAGLTLFRVRGDRKWNVNAHTYGRGGADDVPTSLKLGLVRILDRPEEQAKLNLAPPVLEAFQRLRRDGVLVSEAQQASWEAAAAAWGAATDRASRDAIEQELLGSILDLADRQRAADEARITGVRSLVSAEQFDQICELGRRMTR